MGVGHGSGRRLPAALEPGESTAIKGIERRASRIRVGHPISIGRLVYNDNIDESWTGFLETPETCK